MTEEDVRQQNELTELGEPPKSKAGRKWYERMKEKQAGAVQNLMEGKPWHSRRKEV